MDSDLLADLDDLGEDFDDEEAQDDTGDASENEEQVDSAMEIADSALLASIKDIHDVKSIAKLHNSTQLKDLVVKIGEFTKLQRNSFHFPIEHDVEYPSIVLANNLAFDLDNEIMLVQKFVRDHYEPRFPELESLVTNPIDYVQAVLMIGNEMDLTRVNLRSFLPSATCMVLNVTAATSNGRQLSENELERVIEGCTVAQDLDKTRKYLLDYVESRMKFIAPNLTQILGSGISAKMMGICGGLTNLAKIPACNIIVLGKSVKNSLGLSSVYTGKHQGIVYQCPMVLACPEDVKRKAARIISAKCALAARIDCSRECADGSAGILYREDIQKKIDMLIQPPPGKSVKALPLPKEFKKRRGGKRARKAKERNAASELQKAQNRVAFGQQEEEIGFGDEETVGLGLIGGSTGKVRSFQADTRIKATVAKKYKNSKVFNLASNNNVSSGLASSVAFTPIKGIELENPELQTKKRPLDNEAKDYFSGSFKRPVKILTEKK